jgi:flagella basal body P-ring formation protein FlgA
MRVTEFMALSVVFVLLASAGSAEVIVATRTLRAQSIITQDDVKLAEGAAEDALIALDEAIGQETRVTVYAGRIIRLSEIGPPAIIERNQIVPLSFRRGALVIITEGRALGRGGVGDTVRVMNLASRATVSAQVGRDGTLMVFSND